NVSGNAGITGNDQEPNNWGPPALSFSSGIATLADGQQAFTRNQTHSLSMNTFWSHAPHNVTFGADFRRQQMNYLSQQNARGSFTFNGASGGSDFGDFLLGVPDTSSIAFGNADKYFRASIYDAYFTDDWRVSPSLTVNAGGRWEYSAPITELYGRLVNLDITPGFQAEAPVVASSAVGALTGRRYASSLLQPDKHAFEPRVGIAWRPVSGSSMVVRAGYGITYNTSVYTTIANQMAQQSPLSKSLSVQNTLANPLTLANGFNATPGITPNTFAVDPDFRIGYAQTWQASVQRDLPASLVMTATYLGIKGTRATQAFLPNTFPVGAANPCPSCPSGYTYLSSNGNSTREAGQFQLRRRLHNGITASAQYVFSKALDDAALGGRGQGNSVIAQNWLDLSAERGRSSFDQRHLLNLQAQYSTGVGVSGGTLMSGWRGTLFKEWTIATTVTVGSGFPLTPTYLNAVAGTGVTGSLRPDYTGASIYDAPPGLFLNPAAVRLPASGSWGNAGRNSIDGPGQLVLNGSLARTFRLRDRMSLDLRIDSQNFLNHVTFPSWNTVVTSAQFGLPTAANAMRSVQANVRVRF
ncbi:MAG: TonB-dependent receptor, partial [Acidobacteriota bacterium]|nr:TonB-dependent receptor [Acidobacteriota bacterium]